MKPVPARAHGLLIRSGILAMITQAAFAGNAVPESSGLANAVYSGIEKGSIQLTDGHWEGEPYSDGGAARPTAALVEDFALQADLDGDGADETVVLLWQNSGGSGTFSYIAVMDNVNGEWSNVATAPLGDRVQVRSGAVKNAAITLDVVQQGEEDPACCPSQLATRSWTLEGGKLEEHETKVTGTLSLSTLEDTGWILTQLKQNHHLPEGSQVSLLFSEGRMAGSSGCNRFSASVEGGEIPGEIRIGPAMGTRMACPAELMELENEFLDLLGQVNSYRFLAGKLVLGGASETFAFSMRFSPQ
jgi:heat shock protein HslJ